jgi:hypothetical protein
VAGVVVENDWNQLCPTRAYSTYSAQTTPIKVMGVFRSSQKTEPIEIFIFIFCRARQTKGRMRPCQARIDSLLSAESATLNKNAI